MRDQRMIEGLQKGSVASPIVGVGRRAVDAKLASDGKVSAAGAIRITGERRGADEQCPASGHVVGERSNLIVSNGLARQADHDWVSGQPIGHQATGADIGIRYDFVSSAVR